MVNGQQWEITDLNGYNAGWTYTAKVVDNAGNTGATQTQVVNGDFTEAPPQITGVIDSGSVAVGNNGTTTRTLSSVSGTGVAGNTIYLYDNSGTNLVGTTTVSGSGQWTVSPLVGIFTGSNTFSAKQVDIFGNESVLSNLWTVTAQGPNQVVNGDFSNGLTGWDTGDVTVNNASTSGQNFYGGPDQAGIVPASYFGANITNRANSNFTKTGTSASGNMTLSAIADLNYSGNPDGRFVGNVFGWNDQVTSGHTKFLSQKVSVEAGKTYSFSFDAYGWNVADARFYLGDTFANFGFDTVVGSTSYNMLARISGTFVAATTGLIDMAFSTENQGDVALDNLTFSTAATAPNSLVAGGTAPATPNNDTALTYTSGSLSSLAGNDIITAGTDIQAKLAAGGFIDGGAGVDTLKLAAGTLLDLGSLRGNQTVKPIQEVEVVQMQGASTLTLSANDVLSLGGTNTGTTVGTSSAASPMAPYGFASTTGGTASTSSAGKVQFVVNGTSTDALVLDNLLQDGKTTNGAQGNTGLSGQWDYMGTASVSGVTYKVYNHSTTQAQVLTQMDATIKSNAIAFSSMTKDSSPLGTTADWLTADVSAGRLVSGTVATPLVSGDVVNVYANGTLIGTATVNDAGTAWEITDPNGYNANWVYSANIVSGSVTSTTAYQPVRTDLTEAAPVITAVTDSANASIANAGSTTNALSTVSGTGNAGDLVYLFDNTNTNLVGTAIVAANGTWTVANITAGAGSNTFSAQQIDAFGNQSALSNLWVVSSAANEYVTNGDFVDAAAFTTGFGTRTATNYNATTANYGVAAPTWAPNIVTTNANTGATAYAFGTWQSNYIVSATSNTQRLAAVTGNVLAGNVVGSGTLWSTSVDVVKGQTYEFNFDYSVRFATDASTISSTGLVVYMNGARIEVVGSDSRVGHFKATYTATETGTIDLSTWADNTRSATPASFGDYILDNFSFKALGVANNNSLSAGGTVSSNTGNDTLTAGTDVQATLAAGGFINGGAGVDTLKLAAGTNLNLDALGGNQTVKPIQEVEVFEMQGASTLTMSANDVLSLGATDLAGYSFASTTGGSASTSSTGKVQFVVNGTPPAWYRAPWLRL